MAVKYQLATQANQYLSGTNPSRASSSSPTDLPKGVVHHGLSENASRDMVLQIGSGRGELRDSPMQLGLVSRALCRGILKFARMMAQRRGGDICYAFGDEAHKNPSISLPVMLLDRIFVADQSHPLPVGDPEEPKGTWRLVDGKWVPIERSSVTFDTETYVTVVLATSYIDWTNWQLSSIPGLGTLSLETFWGEQGAWIALCEMEPDESVKAYFLEANLEPVKGSSSPRQSTVYNEDEAERHKKRLLLPGKSKARPWANQAARKRKK